MKTVSPEKPLLLAPAGEWASLSAAIDAGADAVYFGVGTLNMRSHATVNFTAADLPQVVARCHAAGVKAWLTANIIVHDTELLAMQQLMDLAASTGVDAVIAADPAVLTMARQRSLPVHLSVQANVCNIEALRFYIPYIDVAVAARELTLPQLRELADAIRREDLRGPSGELLRLEAFAHGALCIGISGRCGMSLCEYNTSSNRGRCYQPCRRAYVVRDAETGAELKLDNQYIMSPSDLCTIGRLGDLVDAGVGVLKLEGRGRSADYVATVTRCYREALDMHLRGEKPTAARLAAWKRALAGVFNRGFWEGGYYFGEPTGGWACAQDSQATRRKEFVGVVEDYYARSAVAQIRLQAGRLAVGETVLVTGPTTGAVEMAVTELRADEAPAQTAAAGQVATFPCAARIRRNDKVYVVRPRNPA